jgi:O-antigen/teichoic acid export membrane protein
MSESASVTLDETTVPRDRIARAVVIQLAGRALGMVASAVSVAMTARYLGPAAYGQLTIAIVFVGMWASLVDLGVGTVIVRLVSSGRGNLERLVGVNSGLALVYCVPLAVMAAVSGWMIYHDADVRTMLVVMSVSLLFLTTTTTGPVFVTAVKFSAMAIADLASRVALLCVIIGLVVSNADVIWFAVANLIPSLFALLIQGFAASRHISLRPVFSPRETRDLLRKSLAQMAIVVIVVLYWRADGVILSLLSSKSEVGVYGLAQTFALNTMVLSAFFLNSTLSTAAALFARDVAAFAGFMRRSVEIMYVVGLPVAVIGTMLAAPLIRLIGDEEFVERGGPTLALLFIAVALQFVSDTVSQGLFAAHKQRFLLWVAVGALAFNITLNCLLAARYGAVGAGAAMILTELLAVAATSWGLHRVCGYRMPVKFLMRVLVPTTVSAAVVLLLSGWHVLIVGGAAVAAYVLTNLMIGPLTWSVLSKMRGEKEQENVVS